MKKIIVLSLICFSSICFSQVSSSFSIGRYSQPNTKNELSKYFKKNIPKYLLQETKYPNKKGNILLSFGFNNELELYNVKTTTYNKDLNDAIVAAFKKYPIENLNIGQFEQDKNYTIQIISKTQKGSIFNCSSKVIIDSQPICENCEDLNQYEDIKKCFVRDVQKYFYSNYDFELTSSSSNNQPINLVVNYKVDGFGNLENSKSKAPTVELTNEINKVLKSYPTIKKVGAVDSKLRDDKYSFKITILPNEKPVYKDRYEPFNHYTKPSKENELSKYFSEHLTEELINKSNLNSINYSLSLSFKLDRNNNPINIKTNARSEILDKKLIEIFKNYPGNKLPILDKNPLNFLYTMQVMSFSEGIAIINCSTNIGFYRTPIYKGCENTKSSDELKKCLNTKIREHVSLHFNYEPYKSQINLKGKHRILCQLKFEKEGDITVYNIKSPSPLLKTEVLRVVNLMPKLSEPGYDCGKPINVTFMLPISVNLN